MQRMGPKPVELPRQVLLWIQGLDLSYAVKNVKRDFCNGFLVAEMCSRYFDKDVNMHSFSNGSSLPTKTDNWHLLEKLFRRWGIPYDKNLIAEVIHCKPGAAARLLEDLYIHLTSKTVKKESAGVDIPPTQIPPFARETASSRIRNHLKEPKMLAIVDDRTRESKTLEVLRMHESSIQAEKSTVEFAQYVSSTLSRSGPKAFQGEAVEQTNGSIGEESVSSNTTKMKRVMSEDDKEIAPQVVVREVQVKQITRDIAQLRASKELNATQQSFHSPSLNSDSHAVQNSSTPNVMLLALLNNATIHAMQDMVLPQITNSQQPIYGFIHALEEQEYIPETYIPPEVACVVFEEMSDSFREYGVSLRENDIVLLVQVMMPILEQLAETSNVFEACTMAFAQYGQESLRHYQNVPHASDRFMDIALPRFVKIIRSCPGKRHSMLRILYSFTPIDAGSRIQVIKRLHDHVGGEDFNSFLHCLTILIFMEQCFDTQQGETLLDLYIYYALTGISSASQSLRAASVAMLAVVGQFNETIILRLLPRLNALSQDDWWEVQVQLLIVCSKLLEESTIAHILQGLYNVVHTILERPKLSPNVARIGLVYLGRNLRKHRKLARVFLQTLLRTVQQALDENDEYALGELFEPEGDARELPVPSASGGVYRISALQETWDAQVLIEEILHGTVDQDRENLGAAEFVVIRACLHGCKDSLDEPFWSDQFGRVKEYLFLALCDPDSQILAADIIKFWCLNSGLTETIILDPLFPATFQILFTSDQPQEVQVNVVNFLLDLLGAEKVSRCLSSVVSDFLQGNPGLLHLCPALGILEKNLQAYEFPSPPK